MLFAFASTMRVKTVGHEVCHIYLEAPSDSTFPAYASLHEGKHTKAWTQHSVERAWCNFNRFNINVLIQDAEGNVSHSNVIVPVWVHVHCLTAPSEPNAVVISTAVHAQAYGLTERLADP